MEVLVKYSVLSNGCHVLMTNCDNLLVKYGDEFSMYKG
jgi:hypothetical protein